MSNYEAPPVAPEAVQRKRLFVLCDGTGQASTHGPAKAPTNITRFARALRTSQYIPEQPEDPDTGREREPAQEIPQVVLYQTGVGADGITSLSSGLAGAFGLGVDMHVLEGYTFFSNNYEEGDELYLFGFSRGAFTARAIASLICNVGLLKKESIEYLGLIYEEYQKDHAKKLLEDRGAEMKFHYEVTINVMGLFDTVGSLGVPKTWISAGLNKIGVHPNWNNQYGYHDTSFPIPKKQFTTAEDGKKTWKAMIVLAFQALALEENRTSFGPTLLYYPEALTKVNAVSDPDSNPNPEAEYDNSEPQPEQEQIGHGTEFRQCWFPGVHTDVGGGYERACHDISDIAFAWMVDRCAERDIAFADDLIERLKPISLNVRDPKADPKVASSKRKEPLPVDKGWAMSKEHDELHTAKFWAGGWVTRTPGQYFLGNAHEEDVVYATHEEMHPCVRVRMMQYKNDDGSPWRPAALQGFTLERDESGWRWEKKVNINGKQQTVVIPELALWWPEEEGQGMQETFEAKLLTPEAKKLLKSDCDELVKSLKEGPTKTKKWFWQ